MDINHLLGVLLTNSFPFYGLFLCSTGCFLCCTELFSFMSFHMSFGLKSWGNGVLFRTSILTPVGIHLGFLLSVSVFQDSHWGLWSIWDVLQGDRYETNFILLHMGIQFSRHYLLRLLSLGIVVKYQMILIMGTHAYVFYFVLLIYMLVLSPSHVIFINLTLYYGLKYVMITPPNLLFCSLFLVFHEPKFISEYFYVSVKKIFSIFIGIILNL